MVYEIYIKIKYESPYAILSEDLGNNKLLTFCNNFNDLLMIEGKISEDQIKDIKKILGIEAEIQYSLNHSSCINYLIIDCICETNFSHVTELIQKNHGIEISPVLYTKGWEYHEFICINKHIISTILESLSSQFTLEVLYIHEDRFYGPLKAHSISAEQLLNNLTTGQQVLLSEAYNNGYYEIPRRVKLEGIAQRHGKSRYAIESRLRRGENSIMDLVIPMLESIHPNLE